jgi:flagellar biosynthetic protein FlhB
MAADDQAQRTEPATPKRREDSRRKGQVAQSRDLQSLSVLAAAAAVLAASGLGLVRALDAVLRWSFESVANPPASGADFTSALFTAGAAPAWALMPCLVVIPFIAGLVQVAQVGPLFSMEVLQFRGDRLDPVQGMLRLVKPDRWVDLLKTLAKVTLIGLAAWWTIRPDIELILALSSASLNDSLHVLGMVVTKVVGAVLAVIAAIAAIDVLLQRQRHEKQLRMTQREVREELKQVEGDPRVRSHYRSRQQELSRTRMIAAVANADVVVTNPTHFAVALQFDREQMAAPQVVAKGKDRVAARIREAATAAGVPVMEDAPLAQVLHRTCEVGREIPANLFQAVAELLALVYRLNTQRRAGP